MLRSVRELHNFILKAEDGDIGRCKDFLFDDAFWTVRYMVADTGKWLPKRKVLVSPISLGEPGWMNRRLPVRLTKKQIEDSPPLDADAPISRQFEIKWFAYHGYPYYWGSLGVWGAETLPGPLYAEKHDLDAVTPDISEDGSNLRSTKEVMGYHIRATDNDIGHVEDFLMDDRSWTIHYMIVDTRNWLPGRRVLVAPDWIDAIHWAERKVQVELTSEQVRKSPEYDPEAPISRDYEKQLYEFYGRTTYWE